MISDSTYTGWIRRRHPVTTFRVPKISIATILAASALLFAGAGGASSQPSSPQFNGERSTIAGAPAPGPASLNNVFLRKYGPKNARTILILTPGSPGSQGNYANLGKWLVQRVPGLGVWAVDRRSNQLEDVSVFQQNDAMTSLRYYMLGLPVNGKTFKPVQGAQVPYIRKWGAAVAMNDLHRVVLSAKQGGRRVILGGHSAGAVTVPAYTAWDFNGQAGYKDLVGMLQIDGGQFGAFNQFLKGTDYSPAYWTKSQAQKGIALHNTRSAFGVAGANPPIPQWLEGVLPELACQFASQDPQGASVLQSAIPDNVRKYLGLPAENISNEAFMGVFTTNKLEAAFQMRTGTLASTGTPRQWINGSYSSVPSVCATFTQELGNGFEWYYSARLDVDLVQGMPTLSPTGATRYLGLRPRYLQSVNIPLYAFQTSLSQGGVLRGTKTFIRKSQVKSHWLFQDLAMGHFDPLEDFPATNRFIITVVPWLKDLVAGHDPGSRGQPVH